MNGNKCERRQRNDPGRFNSIIQGVIHKRIRKNLNFRSLCVAEWKFIFQKCNYYTKLSILKFPLSAQHNTNG